MNLAPSYYRLDADHKAVSCDMMEWARFIETADRVVARTPVGSSEVSTVFLGLDHNWTHEGPPQIFETMVFGGPLDQETVRYSSWAEAEIGHKLMVAWATKEAPP